MFCTLFFFRLYISYCDFHNPDFEKNNIFLNIFFFSFTPTSYYIRYAGFAFLAGILKELQFFSLNRRVAVMWQAIGDSAPDLVAFLFSFGLLLLGFGYLAHMMWGHSAQTFTTVYNSVTSLFRFWYVVVHVVYQTIVYMWPPIHVSILPQSIFFFFFSFFRHNQPGLMSFHF